MSEILKFNNWLLLESSSDSDLYRLFCDYVLGNAQRLRFTQEHATQFVTLLKSNETIRNGSLDFLQRLGVTTLYRGIDDLYKEKYDESSDNFLGGVQSWTYDKKIANSFGHTVLKIPLSKAIPYLLCSSEYIVNKLGKPIPPKKLAEIQKIDPLGETFEDNDDIDGAVAFMAAVQKEVLLYKVNVNDILQPKKSLFTNRMSALADALMKTPGTDRIDIKMYGPGWGNITFYLNFKSIEDRISVQIQQTEKTNNLIQYGYYKPITRSGYLTMLPSIEYDDSNVLKIAQTIVNTVLKAVNTK